MKRILFVNNYDMAKSRKSYLDGNSASHHQFGTSELIETGEYQVDYMLVTPKGHKNKILKLLSLFPLWLKLYRQAKKYDLVYGGADFTVDFLGVMKQMGLFRPQLVAIFYHPPFTLRIKMERFDHLIFISRFACEAMQKAIPKKASMLEFMQWGPDLAFYQKLAPTPNCDKEQKELIFISNGKTRRDHESLVAAAEQTGNQTIIVSDEQGLPHNYNDKCAYIKIFYQNKPDDTRMVKLLNNCSVLVIPTPADEQPLAAIGMTSFVDAIALGMPVIVADNTAYRDIVRNNRLGFVYKASNVEDLKRAMMQFKENPGLVTEYGKNALEFGQKNNIEQFSKKLHKLFEK